MKGMGNDNQIMFEYTIETALSTCVQDTLISASVFSTYYLLIYVCFHFIYEKQMSANI